MSNEIMTESKDSEMGWGYGHLVREDFFDYLLGRILTLIEVLGLPEKQETQLKSLIRQEIWKDTGIYLGMDLNSAIHKAYYKKMEENNGRSMPISGILLEEIK